MADTISRTSAPAPKAPQPTPPERQFSFTNWSVNNPTTPQPGDSLDAEFDRSNLGDTQIIQWASTSLATDGTLKPSSVGQSQLVPNLFDYIADDAIAEVQPLVDEAQDFANASQASSSAAQAAAAAADTSNTAAQGASGAASAAASHAQSSATDAQSYANIALAAQSDADNAANHAQGDAALASDYAVVTQAWAEHMPDPIPPNILAVMGITGDHWSSRWWATRAEEAFGGITTTLYLGAWPTPPTTTATGDPLTTGALYYNTTSQQPFVWNGSAWVPFYAPTKALLLTLLYRASANQTVFSLTTPDLGGQTYGISPVTPEPVEVYVNGIRTPQDDPNPGNGDWTLTTSTSTVTFLRPLLAGSMVQVDITTPASALAPTRVQTQPVANIDLDPATGNPGQIDGVRTTFPLIFTDGAHTPVNPGSAQEMFISLDGVVQQPNISFTVSAGNIVFIEAPTLGAVFWGYWYGPGLSSTGPGAGFMPISGGTFTGPVTLAGPPTVALSAVTKSYVDGLTANSSIINVLNMGAKGDGTTDDTTAIQSALNTYAGKAIVFIPVTGSSYRTRALTLPSNTNLLIEGTLLALPGLPAGYVTAASASNIIISGTGTIDANGAQQTFTGGGLACLALSIVTNARVSGVTLQNAFHWNMNVTRSTNVVFNGVVSVGGNAAPEFAAGCNNCWLTNCILDGTNCGDYTFCFYGNVTNSGAIGNVIFNGGKNLASTLHAPGIGVMSDAAQPISCHNIIIANNVIHDNAGPGIVVLGNSASDLTTGIVVANNRSYNNDKNGSGFVAGADFFIDYCQDVTITGNSISNNGNPAGPYYTGIFLGPHSSQLNITGNQIFNIGAGLGGPAAAGNYNAGIYAQNPPDTYIANNHFYDNQPTPTMQRSVTGGVGARSSFIGNHFGVSFICAYPPDAVFANVNAGVWNVATAATFNVNANFIGGATISNGASVAGGLSVTGSLGVNQNSVISSTNWQHSGAWIGWNYTSNGMTNFFNSKGVGTGGFTFYNVDSNTSATPVLLSTLNSTGTLTIAGPGISYNAGGTQSAFIGFQIDATTNALQVYSGGVVRIPTNAANDAAAATAGVPVGGEYRNGSIKMIRVA